MSRVGVYRDGRKYIFTHRDPQTGRFWSDEIGKDGAWVDSKNINFDVEKPKVSRFTRKGR